MVQQGRLRVNVMEPVIIDAGTLEFSAEDMTATGLLIPFGVECRSNLGMFTFAPGDVTIPEDFTGMSLNVEHKREHVAGGITRAWEQPEGVMATFSYAKTPAGRKAFEEGKNGTRKSLSSEVANVRIQGGKALPGALLFGAAQVERPAFAGATLLAAEDTPSSDEWESPNADRVNQHVTEWTDDQGVRWRRVEENTSKSTITKVSGEAEDDTDTENTPEPEEEETTLNASATDTRPKITLPATFLGSAPQSREVAAEDVPMDTLFAAIAAIKNRIPGAIEDATTLLAALSDVKYETAGGLTGANSGVLQPAWVGKLWQGRRYTRKYLDLATHLYGGIQLGGRSGFTMNSGVELVQEWLGNKADIPSPPSPTTGLKKSKRRQYGWGADIAREWYDLEGGADVIEELFKLVADSYARVTDRNALQDIVSAATRTVAANDRVLAPKALPAGTPANSAYYPGVVALIQAIEAITDADDAPSFAVVNPTTWDQLVYTPKDLLPEYVQLVVKVGEGEASVDGKVKVVKAPQSFFPGLVPTAPAVVAGAKGAIEFREQGQTPIQIDAIDIARGGVDKAVVGYMETFVVREESLAAIGTKA